MRLNNIRLMQNVLLGFSLLAFFVLISIVQTDSEKTQSSTQEILQCEVKNLDGEIQIGWKISNNNNIDRVEVSVSGRGLDVKENFSTDITYYSFTEGKHGKGYDISVRAKRGDKIIDEFDTRLVFLNFDKLPDLPIISIDTRNGKPPAYMTINHPEGAIGSTITDNDFLDCVMTMTRNGVKIANSRARFRVRGNTSANWVNKPYKLELQSAADLLELGNEYADKEWVLLNQANSMNTLSATKLVNLFNVDWQPQNRFVNLVINGKWSGCCILSQTVKRGSKKVNISRSGFIFEYDPYFWKPNTIFFKTKYTNRAYAYTFKYPKKKNLNRYDVNHLKNHLQKFEDLLYAKDERYADYIDVDSFATWILIHDLIGTLDGAGSNMYFYKYDFDINNPLSTKIKRGPLWDFDSAFRLKDQWSRPHHRANYQQQLFRMSSFRKAYTDKFESFKDKIIPQLSTEFEEFQKSQGADLQESWNLHAQLWNLPHRKVNENISDRLKFLQNKIKWIDARLKNNDWE